jgi:trigger factor
MKVEVESLDRVRKNVEVIIDDEKVNELRNEIYEQLKKQAKVKGFRPGKAPRSVLQTLYKDYVDDELKKRMVEETMGEALTETKVDPVSEPRIEFVEEGERFGYKMECEVEPEFDLPVYEGIEAEVEKIQVAEADMDARLKSMQEMHTQLVDREADAIVGKGDFVVVKYEGFLDGKPVKDIKSDSYPLDLGDPNVMPEFESGLMGAKIGEEKEIELKFADNYPDKDIAGKPIIMKVAVKEIKEKRLPELNDDFAKDVGSENMGVLKDEVRKALEKEQEAHRKNVIMDKVGTFLLEKTDIPVPARLLQKRVEMLVEDAKGRMKAGSMSSDDEMSLSAALRKDYEPEAEKRIRMGMILAKIAEKEGLTVEDDEVDDRLKRIAEETKKAYDYIRDFYAKYNLRDNLRNSLLEEKTFNLLIEKAAVKEKA